MNAAASEARQFYVRFTRRKISFTLLLLVALVGLAITVTCVGTASVRIKDVGTIILARLLPFVQLGTPSRIDQVIILEVRLPRILLAVAAGTGLAVSGAVMQGVLHNPLASPYTLGLSSGAAFGAALAIVAGVGVWGGGRYLIVGNAFVFAVLTMALVYGIARIKGATPGTIILAGIAVSYLFSALVSGLKYAAGEQELRGIIFWILGGLYMATWEDLPFALLPAVIGMALMMRYAWDLNVLEAGEEVAQSLGVNVRQVRIICLILC